MLPDITQPAHKKKERKKTMERLTAFEQLVALRQTARYARNVYTGEFGLVLEEAVRKRVGLYTHY